MSLVVCACQMYTHNDYKEILLDVNSDDFWVKLFQYSGFLIMKCKTGEKIIAHHKFTPVLSLSLGGLACSIWL